jgi:flagellar motor protein MotB
VAADRLTTSGFGDTKPVAPNTDDGGRAQNRRVELVKK